MDIGRITQLEMLHSFLRQKADECDDILKQLPGFDGDTEIALLMDKKARCSFFIFPQDAGMVNVLFDSLRTYYYNKAIGIESEIALLRRTDTVIQTMPI